MVLLYCKISTQKYISTLSMLAKPSSLGGGGPVHAPPPHLRLPTQQSRASYDENNLSEEMFAARTDGRRSSESRERDREMRAGRSR